jgi:UDP-GlcNAc:undecaprenyl-phosphate GlcNAc-1-phosphate transferase
LSIASAISGTEAGTAGIVFLAGAVAMFAVGLIDDFRDLRARYKLGIQLLVALGVCAAGFRFEYLPTPAGQIALGPLSWILTLIWIVGISNAINMIDGMDGLAGGISLIASVSYGTLLLGFGDSAGAMASFVLAGAIVGFLFFNLPPARIFMGDSGSLLIGFCLAALPLLGDTGHPRTLSVLAAGTILAVPVFDVFAAILRRKRRGKRVMEPDREHLHHKLMDHGLGVRSILAIVYVACICLGTVAAAGRVLGPGLHFWVLIGSLVLLAVAFVILHFAKERRVNGNGKTG